MSMLVMLFHCKRYYINADSTSNIVDSINIIAGITISLPKVQQ